MYNGYFGWLALGGLAACGQFSLNTNQVCDTIHNFILERFHSFIPLQDPNPAKSHH